MSRLIYKHLETERLLLRYPLEKDNGAQYKYLSNKSNFPFADYKIAKNMSDIDEFFDKMLKVHMRTSLFWMICLKQTNISIGTISAWNVDFKNNSIEFGYSLYPKYRGLGYMQEALKAVIDYCYSILNFTVFDIWTHKDNKSSINIAKNLNFEFKGYVTEKAKNYDGDIIYATYQLIKDID